MSIRVRYIVDDVDAAIDFYTTHLDFQVEMHPAPGFAALSNGDLTLLLNTPGAGGAGRAGGDPRPGGWNRFQIEVPDIDETVRAMSAGGVGFRGEMVEGNAGRQVLVEDPSGNPVELFERY